MTRFNFFLLWLLHFLPNAALTRLGRLFGALLYALAKERRHVASTNLRLCFPEKSEAERTALAREHFALVGQTLFERVILYWGSEERLKRMIRIEGAENLSALHGQPVIIFCFHSVGMEVAWIRLTMVQHLAVFHARMKNAELEERLMARRNRFQPARLVSNKEGIKPALEVIRSGTPLTYLPDMDFGRKHSIFVPFFAANAATIPGLSRMAAATGAKVVPLIPTLTPEGWVVNVGPAWENFPTDDVVADTRRMNAFIEEWVLHHPAQYWWLHKRFKTRPEGEKSVY
ncbi:MAG: lipid A biosynthesis acyltransferase [Rhodocyclaceae bacterium]|jgi:KDO2-lipid IV(A) lauroyltransferase|nr:lipid A biosynthesis acyltransferase [Rhodocyclaceae bacterium]MBK6908295.1 lipid A biosynthesis acyltransferase [Rhodocyclaceae bacterium]